MPTASMNYALNTNTSNITDRFDLQPGSHETQETISDDQPQSIIRRVETMSLFSKKVLG